MDGTVYPYDSESLSVYKRLPVSVVLPRPRYLPCPSFLSPPLSECPLVFLRRRWYRVSVGDRVLLLTRYPVGVPSDTGGPSRGLRTSVDRPDSGSSVGVGSSRV